MLDKDPEKQSGELDPWAIIQQIASDYTVHADGKSEKGPLPGSAAQNIARAALLVRDEGGDMARVKEIAEVQIEGMVATAADPEMVFMAIAKLRGDLEWLSPNNARMAHAVIPRMLAEHLLIWSIFCWNVMVNNAHKVSPDAPPTSH